jgi:molecular chaperone HtpG
LKQAGHDVPTIAPTLEINLEHILVKRLKEETDDKQFSDWAHILFDQALLSEGGQLEDPAQFVGRLNDMLTTFALTK